MAVALATFVAGFVFACGLGLSGMTRPGKVIGFLDLAGAWDPSLACVMAGAVATHALLARVILRRPSPLFALRFALPTRSDVDARLVIGSAIFGIGWGLGGFCPGPAIVSLLGGRPEPVVFVIAMLAGMALYRVFPEPGSAHDLEAVHDLRRR